MSNREHWQAVYRTKAHDGVSWFREHLEPSLSLIEQAGVDRTARIVDVGGGASTLVDDLQARGFGNLAVLDLSEAALASSRERLGEAADAVDWVVGDVTTPLLAEHSVQLWHDRAVFHFLTQAAQRKAYVEQLLRSTAPGAHVLIATFGPDGPEKCSGLPVARYDAAGIAAELGPRFALLAKAAETHQTPWGSEQSFTYALFQRSS